MALLISFSGLPGAGKTTIARQLASDIGAVHMELDAVEAALRRSLPLAHLSDSDTYYAAYLAEKALAEASLRLDVTVIVDAINPIQWTRGLWTKAAEATGARLIIVEVICSDGAELHRRLEEGSDPNRIGTPRWVPVARGYKPWDRERVVIDTASTTIEDAVARIREAIAAQL